MTGKGVKSYLKLKQNKKEWKLCWYNWAKIYQDRIKNVMHMFQIIELGWVASTLLNIYSHFAFTDSYNINGVLAVWKPILFLMDAIFCLPRLWAALGPWPGTSTLVSAALNVVRGTTSGIHKCGMSHPRKKRLSHGRSDSFHLYTLYYSYETTS